MPKPLKFEDLKTTQLGRALSRTELMTCRAVYGGVSWPGKRPGFAVVIAMDPCEHLDGHDIVLLAEYESVSVRDLVRQCGSLDFAYSPKRWIGDWKYDPGSRFIQEMNGEQKNPRQKFNLNSTSMLEMEHLYQYILDEIKRLVDKDRRQLFLKNSEIVNYLSEIEESETATLELGEYPAIEAIAFAVIEMRKYNFDYVEEPCASGYDHNPLNFGRRKSGGYTR